MVRWSMSESREGCGADCPCNSPHFDGRYVSVFSTGEKEEWLEVKPGVFSTGKGGLVREFETGANRDSEEGKFDYEGFLSPFVVERFGAYMHKNRRLADGSLRDSDNWQKGIPFSVYMKSLWRHFLSAWKHHRVLQKDPADLQTISHLEEDLCAIWFNTQGYLHELLKKSVNNHPS